MSDLRKKPRRFGPGMVLALEFAHTITGRLLPGRRFYRRSLERGAVQRVDVDVAVVDLPPELEGLRLVQISDLHAGPFVDEATLQPALDIVRGCKPHLLVITGDLITFAADEVRLLGCLLRRIEAPLGAFAVFGNHDYHGRREDEIAAWLRRQGVVTLRNATRRVEWKGRTIAITGLEDIEESRGASLDEATIDLDGSEDVRVLLCHHPDVGDSLPSRVFHLVLTGHTHGGQIVFPGWESIAARWMPGRVRGTHRLHDGTILHVNRGLGVLVLPLRVGSRPEVTCATLRAAEGVAS